MRWRGKYALKPRLHPPSKWPVIDLVEDTASSCMVDAEHRFDGSCLAAVIQWSGRSVGVDVADLFERYSAISPAGASRSCEPPPAPPNGAVKW